MSINIFEPEHFKYIRYFLSGYTLIAILLIIFLFSNYVKEIMGIKKSHQFTRFGRRPFGFIYTALTLALLLGVQYRYNPIIHLDFDHPRASIHMDNYADVLGFIQENTKTILLNENDHDDFIPYRETDQTVYEFMKNGSDGKEALADHYVDAITIWEMPFDADSENFKNTFKVLQKQEKYVDLFGIGNIRSPFNSNNILLGIKSLFLLIFPFSIRVKEH